MKDRCLTKENITGNPGLSLFTSFGQKLPGPAPLLFRIFLKGEQGKNLGGDAFGYSLISYQNI